MPNTVPETVRVAVGVIEDSHHQILVTRRAAHKHQGGKWEFPGGKILAGESVPQALTRELYEELGIRVQSASPLLRVAHRYPEKNVLLDVWHVLDYTGNPEGREGQPLRWLTAPGLTELDLPVADLPIVRALQLPSLCLISDSSRYGRQGMLERLQHAFVAGVRLLQLREPHMSHAEYIEYARQVTALAHRHGARVLLNADPGLVEPCDADGVHLNSQRLRGLSSRPLARPTLVAASCHDHAELLQASRIDADFVLLSPVHATVSHPNATVLGWADFEQLRLTSDVPVYALGGMQPGDLPQARACGARGLAMIRGIWEAPDIGTAVAPFRD